MVKCGRWRALVQGWWQVYNEWKVILLVEAEALEPCFFNLTHYSSP